MERNQYLSQKSLDKLKEELDEVKFKKIPAIADKINEAKAQGDLSENAEYHEAKEDMAWAQGRLMELDQIINTAIIIDETQQNKDEVNVGSTIEVETGEITRKFTIVGPQEADPANDLISNESPMGEAFIGQRIKDVVEVRTPGGIKVYKILSIK